MKQEETGVFIYDASVIDITRILIQ